MSPSHNIEVEAGKESRVKSTAWILAGVLAQAAAAPAPPALPSTDRAAYLARLRDGRFAAAEKLTPTGTQSPEDLFFTAFTTYWTLVFDDDNEEHQALLDRQLDAAVAAAAKSEVPDLAALWSGNSHLLLAQLRAWERRPLGAAFEAKKAKKALETAVKHGVESADASFGLGTYNYMADTVPSYVKGLRALLFLPAGNRQLGLDQLEDAADHSRYFAFEARVLLITIYANKHERLYDRAMAERDKLMLQAPDTVASLYASARLDLSLGRNETALASLARAAARADSFDDVDPVVLRSIDLLRARGEFAALRPDLAAATARKALATHRGLSPAIRESLTQVLDAAQRNAEGIDWPAVAAEDGGLVDAARAAELAGAQPDRPLLALIAGDANLRAGKAEDAIRWLDRAAASQLAPALRAGCQLRQGQASDLLGQRSRAIDFYKRAAETPGFIAKDAAVFYQQAPYRSGA
jgi:hypothetical protein